MPSKNRLGLSCLNTGRLKNKIQCAQNDSGNLTCIKIYK